MFVEPLTVSPAIARRICWRDVAVSRVGGTMVRAVSEKTSSATMSPSFSLPTSIEAACRAFSILAPAIEPEVSTTSASSIGGRAAGRISGTSTQTPRNVSRVLAISISPSAEAPIHGPLWLARFASAGSSGSTCSTLVPSLAMPWSFDDARVPAVAVVARVAPTLELPHPEPSRAITRPSPSLVAVTLRMRNPFARPAGVTKR